MKLKNLARALEDFEETPIPAAVVDNVEVQLGEPQVLADPTMAPAVLGAIAADAPIVTPTPLPTIDEGPVEEVSVVPVEETLPVVESVPVIGEGQDGLVIDQVVDHDDTLAQLQQNQVEEVQLAGELGQVMEIQTGLENYIALLKTAGPDGVSRQTAGFIRVGLEHFQDIGKGKLDLTEVITSLEDMGEGEKDHILPSKLKASGLVDKLAAIAKSFWEWIKKVYAKGAEFVQLVTSGLVKLDARIDALEKKAEAGGEPGGEYLIPNPEKIAVGTNVNPQVASDLVKLTKLATISFPGSTKAAYSKIAAAIKEYDVVSGDASQVESKIESAAEAIYVPGQIADVYPGNFVIDPSEDGGSVGIVPGEQPDIGEVTAERRSVGTIKTNIVLLKEIVTDLKKYHEAYKGVGDAAESVAAALDQLAKDARQEGMEDSAATETDELARKVSAVVHKTNPRGNELVRYIVRTLNAYVDVISAELSAPAKA